MKELCVGIRAVARRLYGSSSSSSSSSSSIPLVFAGGILQDSVCCDLLTKLINTPSCGGDSQSSAFSPSSFSSETFTYTITPQRVSPEMGAVLIALQTFVK